MELNKKELKKLVIKLNTIAKARKQIQEQIKYWGYDNTTINVRCYSDLNQFGFDEYSTDLQIEMTNGDEWKTIILESITVRNTKELDDNKFEELTWDIFKTTKNNMIKELKSCNYEVKNTEDYHC